MCRHEYVLAIIYILAGEEQFVSQCEATVSTLPQVKSLPCFISLEYLYSERRSAFTDKSAATELQPTVLGYSYGRMKCGK